MRLLELYDTVQGEGPNVGLPTTFVRFAGCNMRCPGWPCDTPYAVFPTLWRKESVAKSPDEILTEVEALVPRHLCITGGEPLLQPRAELQELLDKAIQRGFTIDLFTNGSRDFLDYHVLHLSRVTIVMDWKLEGSGEANAFLSERRANVALLRPWDAIKFVVKDKKDLGEATRIVHKLYPYYDEVVHPQIYFGTAWEQEIPPAKIVETFKKHDLPFVKLNLQIHKYIFDPNERGI